MRRSIKRTKMFNDPLHLDRPTLDITGQEFSYSFMMDANICRQTSQLMANYTRNDDHQNPSFKLGLLLTRGGGD